jgi:hypothetical protein
MAEEVIITNRSQLRFLKAAISRVKLLVANKNTDYSNKSTDEPIVESQRSHKEKREIKRSELFIECSINSEILFRSRIHLFDINNIVLKDIIEQYFIENTMNKQGYQSNQIVFNTLIQGIYLLLFHI